MRREAPDWAAVRADYEGGHGTLAEIRARHGVGQAQLNERRNAEAWTPRRPGSAQTSGARLARRLLSLLEKIAHGMETKLMAGKDVDANELRLLDTMVKALERLIAMEKGDTAPAGKKRGSAVEAAALRAKLVERITTLGYHKD